MSVESLGALWLAVLAEIERLQDAPAGEDDDGMSTAPAADLLAWVDDLEARIGWDVDTLRPLVVAYVEARYVRELSRTDTCAEDVRNAARFVRILAQWLGPVDFAEMRARNAVKPVNVCHSHDFCDANMAMHAALGEPEITDQTLRTMARVWEIAEPAITGAN